MMGDADIKKRWRCFFSLVGSCANVLPGDGTRRVLTIEKMRGSFGTSSEPPQKFLAHSGTHVRECHVTKTPRNYLVFHKY